MPRQLCVAGDVRMAIKLSIDTDLLNEALTISGLSTKKDTVNLALMEFVQRRKQREITTLFWSLPSDADYNYKKGRQ
jgi:Arc/MetJ family transcription regulator